MDYVIDFYFETNTNISSNFIYNDRRILSKIYIFLKLFGFIFYLSTLSTCNIDVFYVFMIFSKFITIINNIRYEYIYHKKYGTVFNSEYEFELWKNKIFSESKLLLFSIIEFIIKIGYFIKIYPPLLTFNNSCEIGQSIFKIHIIFFFIIYIFFGILSVLVLSTIYLNIFFYSNRNRTRNNISFKIPLITNNNQNEECCICIDSDNTKSWSILSCGHKFHNLCISQWLNNNISCPLCRQNNIL